MSHREYYHGTIQREEAVNRLVEAAQDGTFLLRMSSTQRDVYTISVLQQGAVRHIRVLNLHGGYALSEEETPEPTVWRLVEREMHKQYHNAYDRFDAVCLRYPLPAPLDIIHPDVNIRGLEEVMPDLDPDVQAFLEGGVRAQDLVRARSVRGKPLQDVVRETLDTDDADLERFMTGAITAEELQSRRQRRLQAESVSYEPDEEEENYLKLK
eukprot:m.271700 g.271700  ORF g.271700 m.271700 type:complete len:211 (+) comp22838_c10_seq1:1639-2271(+)